MCSRVIRSLVLAAAAVLFLSRASFAQVEISVTIEPPELPVYDQPICPGDGYLWTPGYWAWSDDYYWVPGTWVLAPEVGFFWTPCWWGWGGSAFIFHEGYWGPTTGFYGGVCYGFGYFGHGYEGGRWDHGHFFYNTAVNHVNVNVIHNTYNTRVNERVNRVSYNGGRGGINERATSQEEAAARGRHIAPVAAQTQHAQAARNEPQQRLSANHGAPPVAATPQPGALRDRSAVSARGGAGAGGTARSSTAVHPKDLAPARPAAPNTGNPKQDQKYQKQQDQLTAKQAQERQKLQQQQDTQHQQMAKQKSSEAKTQQVEQRHQQQTQQLQQKHTQQTQQMQQRQQPNSRGGGRHP